MATADVLIEFSMYDYLDEGILREKSFREKLKSIDWTQYDGKKILVKGCGAVPAPTWAYMLVAAYLANHADYVGYGEGCSSVTVYKRPKVPVAS